MDHIHTFLTTQGHGGPPRMSDQPNAGVTSETAQTWKTIHTKHTLSHPNKANMEWWWRRPNDMRGPWGLKFPDICLTGEEKPRKNVTQETCPDRGSNPGPLRDKRACYHLLHSGGPLVVKTFNFYLLSFISLKQPLRSYCYNIIVVLQHHVLHVSANHVAIFRCNELN